MVIRIGFFTGGRSEFGVAKRLLSALNNDNRFNLDIFVTGMHLLNSFGYTKQEILGSGFDIYKEIPVYQENRTDKGIEFYKLCMSIYNALKNEIIDYVFIIGDRLEPYAAALAAHFLKISIIHSGGGNITKGALDNIYRYNISNLAKIHLTTSKMAFNRLKSLPVINSKDVYFVGSTSIDAIYKFLKDPVSIYEIVPNLKKTKFVLMTFHPVTAKSENIANIMEKSIEYLIANNYSILLTYPNNDEGYEKIIKIIKIYDRNSKLYIRKNLGSKYYYAALNQCEFVIGNSSSGIVEAPYFSKYIINIGTRQEGREKDDLIIDADAKVKDVIKQINKVKSNITSKKTEKCNCIYGDGNAVNKIKSIILKKRR